MKTRAPKLLVIAALLLPVRGPAQSTVPWNAVTTGYTLSASAATILRSVAGQPVVGATEAMNAAVVSGFLADTRLRAVVPFIADTLFPFETGNAWYYRQSGNLEPTIKVVKSILGPISPLDAAMAVRIAYVYPDSTGQGTEYWKSTGGKLYRSSDPGFSYARAIYDASRTRDSMWETSVNTSEGFKLIPVTLFGIATSGQEYYTVASRSGYSRSTSESAAPRLGFVKWFEDTRMGDNWVSTRTLQLVGMILDGMVYGDTTLVTGVDVPVSGPSRFSLSQNYPNPFNPSTSIAYELPHESHVTLAVFNTLGQRVKTLVDGEMQAGRYGVTFDASGLASGVYIYRLQAGEVNQSRKMVLVR